MRPITKSLVHREDVQKLSRTGAISPDARCDTCGEVVFPLVQTELREKGRLPRRQYTFCAEHAREFGERLIADAEQAGPAVLSQVRRR